MKLEFLKAVAASQPYPLLFATVSGAHLFGFPAPDSDYDLRGVHILPLREVVGLYPLRDTLEVSEIRDGIELDLVTYDVRKFIEILLKRSGEVLESLYSPLIVQTSPEHAELKQMALTCVTRHHVHHYIGFSRSKWDIFEKDKQVKALLYVYRVLLTGIHLMQTGKIECNLTVLNEEFRLPYIPEFIQRRQSGEQITLDTAEVEFHRQEVTRLRERLDHASAISHLPDMSPREPLNDWLLRVRGV